MDHNEGQKPGRRREPTGELIGPYAVIAPIASGEATTVHLAQKAGALGFYRLAAVKRLKSPYGRQKEWVQLLLDEARLCAGVHHANIVDVIDVGTDVGCYVVMDYVEGADLEALLARAGKERHPRYVVPPLVDTLHGLHAVHTALDDEGDPLEMVHQAPRARHILVGIDGTARLGDFSQAAAHGLGHSALRYARLKPGYMAPEQLVSQAEVSARTDLFIVGIALWEALTGERLFQTDSLEQSRRAVLERHIPRPSEVGVKPPRCFDTICMRALARDPAQRYPSALEMARDLRDAAMNEALYATAGELGQWVRALAGRALIERRRAIGADAPSLEMAIDTLEAHSAPSVSSAPRAPYTVEISTVSGGALAAPDRSPIPSEPSRVARARIVPITGPNAPRVAPGSYTAPAMTMLGVPGADGRGAEPPGSAADADLRDPTVIIRHDREHGQDPVTAEVLDVRYEPVAARPVTRFGLPLESTTGNIAKSRAHEQLAPADDEDESGAAEGMVLQGSQRAALVLPAQGSRRAEIAALLEAPVSAPRLDPADSLRPAVQREADEDDSSGGGGLGIVSLLLIGIIVVACVVGFRQWSEQQKQPSRTTTSAGQGGAEQGGAPTTADSTPSAAAHGTLTVHDAGASATALVPPGQPVVSSATPTTGALPSLADAGVPQVLSTEPRLAPTTSRPGEIAPPAAPATRPGLRDRADPGPARRAGLAPTRPGERPAPAGRAGTPARPAARVQPPAPAPEPTPERAVPRPLDVPTAPELPDNPY